MSKYFCWNCKCEVPGDDLKAIEESRGEFWGTPCYETVYVCPHCGSDDLEEVPEESEEEGDSE